MSNKANCIHYSCCDYRPQRQTTAGRQDSHVEHRRETWLGNHDMRGCSRAQRWTWSCRRRWVLHPGCVATGSPDLYNAPGLYDRRSYPAPPRQRSAAHRRSRTEQDTTYQTSTIDECKSQIIEQRQNLKRKHQIRQQSKALIVSWQWLDFWTGTVSRFCVWTV